MTLNVENLFDTIHDTGKQDFTYLPLSEKKKRKQDRDCGYFEREDWRRDCLQLDWNETAFKAKAQALANAILAYNQGKGPDVLLLQEVENLRALNQLVYLGIKAARYHTIVLIEGPDQRGIDGALLSRLPINGSPRLHEIKNTDSADLKLKRDQRGILQVDLELPDQQTMSVFVLHFPAPAHPISARQDSMRVLHELLKSLPRGRIAIAGGDINMPSQIPAETDLLTKTGSEDWLISHLVGCSKCKGTVYYTPKKVWSFFDVLFFSKNLASGDPRIERALSSWVLDTDSIAVSTAKGHVDANGIPIAFDPKTFKGVSDHLPMTAVIRQR